MQVCRLPLQRKLIHGQGMLKDRSMTTVLRALVALLIVFAVFAVLVSPAPDELPGTTPHLTLYALTFVFTILSVGDIASHFTELDASMQLPADGNDLLILQCTRIC
jgi:hypothetical protein